VTQAAPDSIFRNPPGSPSRLPESACPVSNGISHTDVDIPYPSQVAFQCGCWTLFNPYKRALFPLNCDRWDCPDCRAAKVKRYQHAVALARPTHTMTLTNIAERWDVSAHRYRRSLASIAQGIRRKVGMWEYWASAECTERGSPHYHLACRWDHFLTWRQLLPLVRSATKNASAGARVEEIMNVLALSKYIAKHLPLEHGQQRKVGRVLRVSKGFYTPEGRALLYPERSGQWVVFKRNPHDLAAWAGQNSTCMDALVRVATRLIEGDAASRR